MMIPSPSSKRIISPPPIPLPLPLPLPLPPPLAFLFLPGDSGVATATISAPKYWLIRQFYLPRRRRREIENEAEEELGQENGEKENDEEEEEEGERKKWREEKRWKTGITLKLPLPSAMGLPTNSLLISQERNVIERITETQRESWGNHSRFIYYRKTLNFHSSLSYFLSPSPPPPIPVRLSISLLYNISLFLSLSPFKWLI